MNFNNIWNFFTYIFRIFKTERRPEYICDLSSDDELEYFEINEKQKDPYKFVMIRD
jgi:hypothetical protein